MHRYDSADRKFGRKQAAQKCTGPAEWQAQALHRTLQASPPVPEKHESRAAEAGVTRRRSTGSERSNAAPQKQQGLHCTEGPVVSAGWLHSLT